MIYIFSSINYRRIKGFTSSILESEKMSQQLLTPVMTPLHMTGLFFNFILLIFYFISYYLLN